MLQIIFLHKKTVKIPYKLEFELSNFLLAQDERFKICDKVYFIFSVALMKYSFRVARGKRSFMFIKFFMLLR